MRFSDLVNFQITNCARHKEKSPFRYQSWNYARLYLHHSDYWSLFWTLFWLFCLINYFVCVCFFRKLISFVQSDAESNKWGYIYASLLFLTVCGQSLVLHQYFQRAFLTGLRVRSAILAAVYKKVSIFKQFSRDMILQLF